MIDSFQFMLMNGVRAQPSMGYMDNWQADADSDPSALPVIGLKTLGRCWDNIWRDVDFRPDNRGRSWKMPGSRKWWWLQAVRNTRKHT